jgi:hypothetical protein
MLKAHAYDGMHSSVRCRAQAEKLNHNRYPLDCIGAKQAILKHLSINSSRPGALYLFLSNQTGKLWRLSESSKNCVIAFWHHLENSLTWNWKTRSGYIHHRLYLTRYHALFTDFAVEIRTGWAVVGCCRSWSESNTRWWSGGCSGDSREER